MLIGLAMVGETESEGELIWLGVPLRFSWSGRTLHLAADVTIVSGNESLDVPLNMVLEFDDACPVPTRYWSGFAGPEALAEQQPFWVFDGECVTMDGPSVARSPMDVPFPRTTWDRHPQSGDSRLPPLEAAIMAGRSDPRTQEVFEGDSWYVQLAEGTPMAGGAAQWDVTVSNVDRTIAFQASIAQGIGIVTDVVSDAARGDARHPIALRYPLLSIATMEDVCDDRFGDAWDGRLSYTDLNGETLVFVGDRLSAGLVTFQCAPSSLLRFDATTGWPLNDIGALV